MPPDLAAEVISPNDEPSKVDEQVNSWLRAGVRVVLVVDPQSRSIREFRTLTQVQEYRKGTLDLGDVLPEFRLDVAELFK